jgi:hypothetical protein
MGKTDPRESLSHALAHHASAASPLAGALAIGFVTKLHANGWEPHGRGPNSQSWRHPSGRQVHFRSYAPFAEIQVKDRYQGPTTRRLRTRVDVMRLIRELEKVR